LRLGSSSAAHLRNRLLLFLRFASELPQSLVEQRLTERLAEVDTTLADFDRLKKEHTHPGDTWVIDYGRTCMQAARNYIHAHGAELIALARPDRDGAAAAE
jgi:PadR family transcriptional regulator AphA